MRNKGYCSLVYWVWRWLIRIEKCMSWDNETDNPHHDSSTNLKWLYSYTQIKCLLHLISDYTIHLDRETISKNKIWFSKSFFTLVVSNSRSTKSRLLLLLLLFSLFNFSFSLNTSVRQIQLMESQLSIWLDLISCT